MSLPLGFFLPAELSESGQVGVQYVSRSFDNFSPKVNIKSNVDQREKGKVKSVQEEKKVDIDDSIQKETVGSRPVPAKSKSTLLPILTESTILDGDRLPSDSVVQSDQLLSDRIVKEVATELSLPDAKIDEQELESASGKSESIQPDDLPEKPVPEVYSSRVETVEAEADFPGINKESDSLSRAKNDANQHLGFKNALPRYDENTPPAYPEVANLRGWEGKVIFEAQILKNGRVGRLKSISSSGYKSLDNAARKAISRWKFKPATSFGLLIDSQVEIPITFSLKDQ